MGLLEVSCQIEIAFDETYSNDADDIQRRVKKAYAVAIVRSDLARALGTCVDLAKSKIQEFPPDSPASRAKAAAAAWRRRQVK